MGKLEREEQFRVTRATHSFHVVLVGAVKVGGARDVEGHRLGDGLEDVGASVTGGDLRADLELGHHRVEVRDDTGLSIGEHLGLVRVGRLPRLEGLAPRL
eukprot:3987835-Pleurochrysis_carterae.AAC.2